MIDGVVDQLTEAMHRVRAAEPEQELDGAAADVVALNELITAATHETASEMGFVLATGASGSPVFELNCEVDGDAIVIRTVLPSVRIPGIGTQVTVVEDENTPDRYLYVGP